LLLVPGIKSFSTGRWPRGERVAPRAEV